ncbi:MULTISPECIES: hypothetical protein [unclassified Kutzneria]|uniref:hypothetical protein n=1 Tax=unclassified Kutzneria TaxID=2621979 RepID=UPI0003EEA92D|nr:hypothetical protein [Kutzneria sp. 744]EWM17824.1 hypothetical protein KUTG_08128 [Kutzneria sp. 744]
MGDKFDLGNAHISGSAIGNRATVNNYAAAPDALLQALLERRSALLGDAPAAGRDDVRARLDEIEAQLRSGKADKEVVRTGWQRIAAVVGVLSEPVMEVTKLIAKFLA